MSRAQARRIEDLLAEISGLREQAAERRGLERGEQRGRLGAFEQMARQLQMSATREEQHRVNAAQAYSDQQRTLQILAAYILDVRGSAEEPEAVDAVELLVEELTAAGIGLRAAFIAVQVERADSGARVTSAAAAAAVATAPIPARPPTLR